MNSALSSSRKSLGIQDKVYNLYWRFHLYIRDTKTIGLQGLNINYREGIGKITHEWSENLYC